MSHRGPSAHPAPNADKLSTLHASVLLYTGPLAWFVQLCAGVTLTSWPCYPTTQRLTAPLKGYGWTHAAALVVIIVCALIAAAAAFSAWRRLDEVKNEKEGGHEALAEIGHGRTRFLALWGTILGTGFALATLPTLVAFLMVPQCLG